MIVTANELYAVPKETEHAAFECLTCHEKAISVYRDDDGTLYHHRDDDPRNEDKHTDFRAYAIVGDGIVELRQEKRDGVDNSYSTEAPLSLWWKGVGTEKRKAIGALGLVGVVLLFIVFVATNHSGSSLSNTSADYQNGWNHGAAAFNARGFATESIAVNACTLWNASDEWKHGCLDAVRNLTNFKVPLQSWEK
ncbi:MAG: hypothetical protein JWL99_4837 [Streptomyces oryziradicis]|nr:hypothetical protein [Actinacidiphila oryziradicis]